MEPSFGPILKKNREAKGLSLRQVSVAIKMNPTMIQDIEEENFDKLPQAVFLRGLVRTYSRYLALDEKEILDIFDSTTKYEKKGAKRSPLDGNAGDVKTPTYVWLSRVFIPIFIIAVLAATGTVIVLVTKKYDKEIRNVVSSNNVSEIHRAEDQIEDTTAEPVAAETTTTTPAATTTAEIKSIVDKKITQVITLEPLGRTMVQVKVDDAETEKIVLRPDVNKTFQAYNKIKLIIQDGGSVNIIHNNKDIGVPGVFGQEIELNFPIVKP